MLLHVHIFAKMSSDSCSPEPAKKMQEAQYMSLEHSN